MPRVSPIRLLLACLGAGAVAALLVRVFGTSRRRARATNADASLDGIRLAREALRAATLASDVDGAAHSYASDCIAVSAEGSFFHGRDRVRERLQHAASAGRFVAADVRTQNLSASGSSAIESGSYSYVFASHGRRATGVGEFTALWTRREGRWTIAFESCRGA